MQYKLILLDVDGTLYSHTTKSIPESTIKALKIVQSKGIKIGIASGRSKLVTAFTGILDILKAYHDCGFDGYIRPDHGRHLWDEKPGNVRPGYGLYDRALGIMYMLGVWDMLDKLK